MSASYWFVILVMIAWSATVIAVNLLFKTTYLAIRFAKLVVGALAAFAVTQYYVLRIIPGGAFTNWLLVFCIVETVLYLIGLLDLVGAAISFSATAAISQLFVYLLQGLIISLPLSLFVDEATAGKIVTGIMSVVAILSVYFGLKAAKRQLSVYGNYSGLSILQAILASPICGLGFVGIAGMIPTYSGGELGEDILWMVGIAGTVLGLIVNLWAAGVLMRGGREALIGKLPRFI